MIILVPYVPGKLHDRTLLSILEQTSPGDDVVPAPVGHSDEAYWEALATAWTYAHERDTALVVVEHDIEIPAGALASFRHCHDPWCAHSYWIYWGDLATQYGGPFGLGCVRFSRKLIDALPNLIRDNVPHYEALVSGELRDGRYWMNLDAAVSQWLKGPHKQTVHQHHPNAVHHHVYDYTGAYVTDEVRATLPEGHPLKEAATHG